MTPESDDEEAWKHAAVPFVLIRRTRADAQKRLDDQFAEGKIDRETWRLHTDLFGEMEWP